MLEVKITIKGIDNIKKLPDDFIRGFRKGLKLSMMMVEGKVKLSFGKAPAPNVITGRLRNSIVSGVNGDVGYVGSNVIYSRILEEGGTILPKTKKYLRFQINGHWICTRKVTIKPHPYLLPSITNNINGIRNIILDNILEATK